jgi:Ser/Thr protein kinase RdoA (MazF antagonist)
MKQFDHLTYRGQVARLRRLAARVSRRYGIEPARIELLAHSENTTFRIDTADGGRYVMRIDKPSASATYPRRTVDRVRSEMQWLAAIRRDTGLVVPEPVATREGDLLVSAEIEGVPGARTCALFRWVEGRFLYDGLRATHLERVGVFAARLHEYSSKRFVVPEGFTRRVVNDVSPQVVDANISSFAEVRPAEDQKVVRAVLERVQQAVAKLGEGSDEYGLIHGDLHQENYLFHKGEVRAIDFDDCGWGHFLYELTVTLSEVSHRDDYAQLRAALLRGYRSVRPLPEQHEQYFPALLALRELHITAWNLEQRHHPAFPNWEKHVDWGLRRLKTFLDEGTMPR